MSGDFHDGGWEPPLHEYGGGASQYEPQKHDGLRFGCFVVACVAAGTALGGAMIGGAHLLNEYTIRGDLKQMHRSAMSQAGAVSLVNAYDIQFLQVSEYRLPPDGAYAGTYAKFGNACLKGTKFDPSQKGTIVSQVSPVHVEVSTTQGERLGLFWNGIKFFPRGPQDSAITDRYKCSYGMRGFKKMTQDDE